MSKPPRTGIVKVVGRDLISFVPAPGSWRVGARAGLLILAALIVLISVDRMDLALYACFGVFATLYGGRLTSPKRWRTQVGMGLLLTASSTSGALVATLDSRAWVAIPVAAAWAGFAGWRSEAASWRPPGPMFMVFSFATISSVPTEIETLPLAILVTFSTAAGAVLLGALETWLFPTKPQPAPPASPKHPLVMSVQAIVAVLLAGTIATAAGIGHPFWAMIAAVVPIPMHRIRHQVVRSSHRVVGTLLGLALSAAILLGDIPTWSLLILLPLLQFSVEFFVGKNYAIACVFITPLAIVLTFLAFPVPIESLMFDRLIETLIGVVVGMAVSAATYPLLRRSEASREGSSDD
ncbi:FUSC family protein [Agrococcus casei]|uniref:FUSC family protein n=1 Tax=Agrococcus casei TaxID=343512 RepID=UPI003F8F2A42